MAEAVSNGVSNADEYLVRRLYETDAVKFGSFKLKSGITSPVYFDLRVIVSYPEIMLDASEKIWKLMQALQYDCICGVPYTALPLASCIATKYIVKMLMKRKEAKNYGTKKMVEGHFSAGDKCVVIEDVVTSGGSVLETVASLNKEGLTVTDVICLLDRNQGGKANLLKHGITLHSVLTVGQLMYVLHSAGHVTADLVKEVSSFVDSNQVETDTVVDPLEDIVLRLHDIGSFRFGSFKLSNGMITPIYVDLRLVISHPVLMTDICSQLYKLVGGKIEFDIVCGVPYAALHLATCIANSHQLTNVLLRKVVKEYGTGKLIEGVYEKGQKCLVVEDVMVSGQGIYEACESIKSQGIHATDALLVLDREQQGEENLRKLGIKLHCLIRISDALDILVRYKRINSDMATEVMKFLRTNPAQIPMVKREPSKRTSKINELLSFDERSQLCTNPVSRRLFQIMAAKKTNLCVSADVTTKSQLLLLAEQVGPHICLLKTHVDILEDFDQDLVVQLQQLAEKYDFLIFEDRKFADIGSTVKQQYCGGMYKIVDWAHLTNAHSLPGSGVVSALKSVGAERGRACLLIAEMSSKGNLANASYSVATVKMAEENSDFVVGFISQSKLTSDPTLIHMTPGVSLKSKGDELGQQYISPSDAVKLRGADVVIVGRGITQADDVCVAAEQYKAAGYEAYELVRNELTSNR